MASRLLELVGNVGRPGLLLLTFFLALGESAIGLDLVVPGEVGMVLSGAAAEQNGTAMVLIVLAGSLGAVAGDCIGFALGRRFGVDVADRWRWIRRSIKPSLERAHRYYADRGGWSVFAARWVGMLRAVVPVVAGSAEMAWPRFLLWDAPSALLWVTATTTAGYLFGAPVADVVDRLGLWVSVVVIGAIVAVVLVRRWHRRRQAADPAAPSVS